MCILYSVGSIFSLCREENKTKQSKSSVMECNAQYVDSSRGFSKERRDIINTTFAQLIFSFDNVSWSQSANLPLRFGLSGSPFLPTMSQRCQDACKTVPQYVESIILNFEYFRELQFPNLGILDT